MNHLASAPFVLALAALASSASAQAPEIIRYSFDASNAANSASPGVGPGTVVSGVSFASGGLCPGSGDIAAFSLGDSEIDSGWVMDLGSGAWSVGTWLDLRPAGNGFQYIWGAPGTGQLRAFLGTGGAVLMSGPSPMPTVSIPGSAVPTQAHHLVFCYDPAASVIRGYLNGAHTVTTQVNAPLNIVSVNTFRVMMQSGTATNSLHAGNSMDDFRFYRRCITQAEVNDWMMSCGGGSLGSSYCGPAPVNSTGSSATMSADGSVVAASNNLSLTASSLPNNSFGYFLTSTTQGFVANPGGSMGNLCLGGSIGRYVGPGQIQNSGTLGSITLPLDLTQTPQPTGFVAIAAGQTWNFQAWYRDAIGGSATSNFTDGLEIDFM